MRYGHEQTAAVMRCVATHGGRELDHAYGERGVELRFLVPLARCDALERCLRDATRGAVTPERLGESVIRTPRRSRAGAPRAACPRRRRQARISGGSLASETIR